MVIPAISILTVVGIIPFAFTVARQLWVRFKITSRRISVVSGIGGKDLTEITYDEIYEVKYVFRAFGSVRQSWSRVAETVGRGGAGRLRGGAGRGGARQQEQNANKSDGNNNTQQRQQQHPTTSRATQVGDMVIELRDGAKLEMRSVPNFPDVYRYIMDKVDPEVKAASTPMSDDA